MRPDNDLLKAAQDDIGLPAVIFGVFLVLIPILLSAYSGWAW